jgi:hypothetical protein
MKFRLSCLLILSAGFVAGCVNAPITQEYMIVNPHTVVLPKGDSVSAVSITHSCTCPFTWTSTIAPASASGWLQFPLDTTGDHPSIPIAVFPSRMPSDTNRATITINSNSYGSDSIQVVAYRAK